MKFRNAEEMRNGFAICTGEKAINPKSETLSGDLMDDNKPRKGDTQPMNEITREEFNARMETIEVKMDSRVESVAAKIDAFVAVQAERDKRMEAALSSISANHSEIKSSLGAMKTTMIVTAVSTVLAIVIGIAGFNAMLTSNMVASFQMGRSERALEATAAQKVESPPPSVSQKPDSSPAASQK